MVNLRLDHWVRVTLWACGELMREMLNRDADADGQEEFVLSVIVQCDAYLGLDQQYDIPIALTS